MREGREGKKRKLSSHIEAIQKRAGASKNRGNDASCVMDILGGKKQFCDLLYCIVNSVMFVS